MKASETTLAEFVQGQKQFQIPLYQRTYSWTEKQLVQLWGDILEQAELLASGEVTGTRHFLGSIVLAPSPLNEPTFTRWLVVDGQQRLTTLTLALAAICDHYLTAGAPQERERIDELFLTNKWKSEDEFFRLLPTQADRARYAEYINGTHTGTGSGDRIGTTYQFFRRKLVEATDPGDPHDVARIEQAITSRLSLVVISAEHGDNVHRIFESLNNTGLKLSQADLLRNYLFMRLPTRDKQVYSTYWLPMQNSLSNAHLEDLMWLQLVLDGDDRVRRQDLYTAQQARFARDGEDEAAIEAYIRELHRRAPLLRRIVEPDTEPDPQVRRYLQRLLQWRASAVWPAVLLLLDRQDRGQIGTAELLRALSYIESFLVRRTICRVPTNNLNRIFQAVPAQLPADLPLADALHQLLSPANRQWPSDDDLHHAVRTAPFYLRGQTYQRYQVLRRLEESFEHPEQIDFDKAELTVEHVLPQTPGPEWLDTLAAECTDGESPESLHDRMVHTLGNLTLTAVNSELSNHPFQRKQDLLAASHLEMNRAIAATARWGAAEILGRADDLADRAIRLWPAPVPGASKPERGRDWQLLHQALVTLPDGTWTSYGDLAALIGSGPQAVGIHLSTVHGIVNAHRVLDRDGRVAADFRWLGEDRGDVHDVLRTDGIVFTDRGAADPAQRLTPEDLADLLGLRGAGEDDQPAAERRDRDHSAMKSAANASGASSKPPTPQPPAPVYGRSSVLGSSRAAGSTSASARPPPAAPSYSTVPAAPPSGPWPSTPVLVAPVSSRSSSNTSPHGSRSTPPTSASNCAPASTHCRKSLSPWASSPCAPTSPQLCWPTAAIVRR